MNKVISMVLFVMYLMIISFQTYAQSVSQTELEGNSFIDISAKRPKMCVYKDMENAVVCKNISAKEKETMLVKESPVIRVEHKANAIIKNNRNITQNKEFSMGVALSVIISLLIFL